MKKTTSLIFILLTTIACQRKDSMEKDQIKKTDWLIGKWENKTNVGTLSENWERVNDSTFKALSLFIKDKDTIHKESIILQQKGETVIYTTIIKGQNNDKPISFQMKEDVEKGLIFENPKNDYPKKIGYKKTINGIITEISGLQSGKPTSEKYILVKQNNNK